MSALYYFDQDATCDPVERENEGCVPALLVWSTSTSDSYIWLVLNERDELRDKVYDIGFELDKLLCPEGDVCDKVYSGWVEWLRHVWNEMETAANSNKPLQLRVENRYLEFEDGIPADPCQAVCSVSKSLRTWYCNRRFQ